METGDVAGYEIPEEVKENAQLAAANATINVIHHYCWELADYANTRDDTEQKMAVSEVFSPVASGVLNALLVEGWAVADPDTTPESLAQTLHETMLEALKELSSKLAPGHRLEELVESKKKGLH